MSIIRDEADRLESELAKVTEDRDKHLAFLAHARQRITEAQDERDHWQRVANEANARATEARQETAKVKELDAVLHDTLARVNQERDDAFKERDEWHRLVVESDREVDVVRTQRDVLDADLVEAIDRIDALTEERDAATAKWTKIVEAARLDGQRWNGLTEERDKLTKERDEARREAVFMTDDRDEVVRERDEALARLDGQQWKTLTAQVEQLTRDNSALEARLSGALRELRDHRDAGRDAVKQAGNGDPVQRYLESVKGTEPSAMVLARVEQQLAALQTEIRNTPRLASHYAEQDAGR